MTEIIGSGLAFPLQVDRRGGIALARDEQDIDQAIELILGTAPGERPMRPEFGCGVHDFVFDTIDANTMGNMEQAIREALRRWEPRIEVTGVDFDLSQSGSGLLTIDIRYQVRATEPEEAEALRRDARALQDAGAFAIVIEKVPAALASEIAAALEVPVIGIGAGSGVDGQILVTHDMLGLYTRFHPRFVRRYAELARDMRAAFEHYARDVRSGEFPSADESY